MDIKEESKLIKIWKPFIHSPHFGTNEGLFNFWIAKHPRRTGEGYWNQYYMSKFTEKNKIPEFNNLKEILDRYEQSTQVFHLFFASSKFLRIPSLPGIVGTFAFFILALAKALSPILAII